MKTKKKTKLPYVLVRSTYAGVFVGDLVEHDRKNQTVVLNNVRRIHYWDGAASLSQLATGGVTKPSNCRFTVETHNHTISSVCEVIPVTVAAKENIAKVPVWKS